MKLDLETINRLVSSVDTEDLQFRAVRSESSLLELVQTTEVVERAFEDYLMFQWIFEKITPDGLQRGIRLFVKLVQVVAIASDGFILLAEDRKTKRVVGAAQVAYENPSTWMIGRFFQKLRIYSAVLNAILFDNLRIPVQVLSSWTTVKRATTVIDVLEAERLKKVGITTRHLYLMQLAADPSVRGNGKILNNLN